VYPRAASLGPQTIRLRPCDHARARIESYRLDVDGGGDHRVHWQRDPHGNHVARVTFKAGHMTRELAITVELAIDIRPVNPFDFFVDDSARTQPFSYGDASELTAFLDVRDPALHMGERARALVHGLPERGDTIALLVEVNRRVGEHVRYVIRDEPGIWTPEQTLEAGRGSCRDSAALLVAILRARGLAARFVSGYLVQLADEGMIPDEPKGVDRDVVDLHAWAEVYVPGAGWIGLDGTSGLFAGEGHIALAATASPAHAAPLAGTSDVAATSVEFATTIGRLGHEVRPTAPYTDAVWHELLAGGDRADAALIAAGLAVTVGGEPTFTSRDPDAGEEWRGGAIGEDKWRRGRELANRLRDRLAPGGVVVHRMGKHYPGESLPRWALDIVARRDAAALWPARELPTGSATASDALRLADAIVAELEITSTLMPAFEDPWPVLLAEAEVPPTIDATAASLRNSEERRRLAAILDQGVGAVIGYVLPLDCTARGAWRTDRWKFRRSQLFLVPGDSPIGLRLPLRSILAAAAPPTWGDESTADDPRREPPPEPEPGVRTALAVEPRAGELWVFVPPLPRFADFCALIAAIDRARFRANIACCIEGYGPPPSADMVKFAVTPDPGVLEVNVAPTTTCRASAELHAQVFELALATGLTAERYLLDGRATGSGGGHHITIGGATPDASPWLMRPDLLASLVTFVQHHPSLSYMFTGLFVGPTSQAPRVDEARHDALAELELALPRLYESPPAWQVDALLRHLLVDVAGSTHRAEISIDKLFDPGTPFGRQGLVELRAFEMPPHPRMAVAQVVLVRALVAAFAASAYRHPLVRWGTELHDRFLLPYWMARDFDDVLAHLARVGVALPDAAYTPFIELRCPLVGALDVAGATIEIRNALEPWPVLGEETTQTGTARYVDSSLERLEVRAIGVDPERYTIAVNGAVLPLRAGAGRDVRVGGVRFRAWAPPHALQPHLGIHHPLHIHAIDAWAERGVAGGTYHVWHPEGRAFDLPPLTRVEAAARRSQRFTLDAPPPRPVKLHSAAPDPNAPYTLDLRRVDLGHPPPRAEDWSQT